ncbi:MAG: 6-phosphogluconolactonase [Lysobacter sp.]
MTLDNVPSNEATTPEPEASRLVLHAHRNSDVWTWASAVAIAAELRRDLMTKPRARLLVSADAELASVYKALSKAPLDWDRVDVGLVDERWLLPDDPDSNARFIRNHLLQDHAEAARFEQLTQAGRSIEDSVAIANAHAHQPASVVVLVMGEDGHTASLFPGMFDLDRVLSTRQPYVAIDTHGSPDAAPWRKRISLTPSGLARAYCRLLLIRGLRKREALASALARGDRKTCPILAAVDLDNATPLHVHWCA